MFITEEPIVVKIHYRKMGKTYAAMSDKEFQASEMDADQKDKYKLLTVRMKPLTWGEYNNLQESAWVTGMDGKRKFNGKLYKESRLVKLMIGWDAKSTNDKGETVPVPSNEANILKLSPDIAEAILDAYDEASLLTEEEEKK